MLSVILPVKSEPYLDLLLFELTYSIHGDFETRIQTEKGLGYAVKCGIEKSKGDIIAVCDADGSHPVKAIPSMLALLKFSEADIVVGSRYVKGGKSKDSFARKLISRFYCEFAKELFGLKVKDNMSGFIVAKKSVFEKYPIQNNGYKILLELLVKGKDLKVVEYPIVFEQRKMGKSKASVREAWHTIIFMLRLKANFKR